VWTDEAPLRERLSGVALAAIDHRPTVSHALTHRELSLNLTVVRGSRQGFTAWGKTGQWVALAQLNAVGLPKPIRTCLDALQPD
jgi:adenine-specific DNA glycosylase